MEAKDIERHKKEFLEVGNKVNDFGAAFALHSHDKRKPLQDICKVTEEIFEIPFKAGYRQGLADREGASDEEYKAGKKAGIREVVEWVNSNIPDSLEIWANLKTNILIKGDKWQAKLKSWNISA